MLQHVFFETGGTVSRLERSFDIFLLQVRSASSDSAAEEQHPDIESLKAEAREAGCLLWHWFCCCCFAIVPANLKC